MSSYAAPTGKLSRTALTESASALNATVGVPPTHFCKLGDLSLQLLFLSTTSVALRLLGAIPVVAHAAHPPLMVLSTVPAAS